MVNCKTVRMDQMPVKIEAVPCCDIYVETDLILTLIIFHNVSHL